jgi:hypothetical protein
MTLETRHDQYDTALSALDRRRAPYQYCPCVSLRQFRDDQHYDRSDDHLTAAPHRLVDDNKHEAGIYALMPSIEFLSRRETRSFRLRILPVIPF